MTGRTEWTAIGCSYRNSDLRAGLEARIADPLWMLARQWQFGAFQGDDAASIRDVRVEHTALDITRLGPESGNAPMRALGPTDLLEPIIEADDPQLGPASARQSGEAGLQLLRRLPPSARADVRRRLQQAFPLQPPEAGTPRGARVLAALVHGSFDAAGFAPKARSQAAALAKVAGMEVAAMRAVLAAWVAYFEARFVAPSAQGYWDTEQLTHAARAEAGSATDTQLTLTAPAHDGEALDWYSFDVAPLSEVRAKPPKRAGSARLVPMPVRYSGMPSDRFWDFEEGEVYFGGLGLETTDLPQLVLTEFATVYSNDWFAVPVPAATGQLVQVTKLEVRDIFGGVVQVPAAAVADDGIRPWRFFELAGDASATGGRAPWLYLPRAVVGGETGAAVEAVTFVRDEQANLAWGIEARIEGAGGYPIDRAQEWQQLKDQVPEYLGDDVPPEAREWVYRLLSTMPGHWVPFAPQVAGSRSTGRLQRSRMQEWELLGDLRDLLAGPRGQIMDASAPMLINDEALVRGGIRAERRYQVARATDGRLLLWSGRATRPASGDRSSGRRTDRIERGKGR